jgi:hypothetical protein
MKNIIQKPKVEYKNVSKFWKNELKLKIDPEIISSEMKKALIDGIPEWWNKQNNDRDKKTNFIYELPSYTDLKRIISNYIELTKKEIDKDTRWKENKINVFTKQDWDYAINRWFNYLASLLSEFAFTINIDKVRKESDIKHHDIDIWIKNSKWEEVPFDIKWSVYPKKYNWDWEDNDLLNWLINNASKEWRKHIDNRLFIIYKSTDNNHKKAKAEWEIIKKWVDKFLNEWMIKKVPIKLDDWTTKYILCWIIKAYL